VVARALSASASFARSCAAPPLPATRHLVHAVASTHPPGPTSVVDFVLTLFERLERRDRYGGVRT
jgi:hypothetical protein